MFKFIRIITLHCVGFMLMFTFIGIIALHCVGLC